MALQLSPRIQRQISEKVASGKYPDADAVIEIALTLLSDQEKLQHVRDILSEASAQVERGEAVEFTAEVRERLWQSALRRAADGETPSPDVCP